MSIIAEALKRAQRKGRVKVEEPPPFDLKKVHPPEAPGQAGPSAAAAPGAAAVPRARPVAAPGAAAVPRARPVAAPGMAPRPRPVAAEPGAKPATAAAPAAKAARPKRWSMRLPVISTIILLAFTGLWYYANKIYLPRLQQGGIQVSQQEPEPSPTAVSGGQAETGAEAGQPGPEATGDESAVAGETADAGEAGPAAGIQAEPQEETSETPEPPVGSQASRPQASLQTAAVAGEQMPARPFREEPSGQSLREQDSRLPASLVAELESPGPALPDLGESERETPASQQTPPEIVQKNRDTGKPLREDIYHFNMAVFFQRQGDVQTALKEYGQVLEISPYNAEVYSNMGVLYNQVGEYDKAVAVLQKALLIDPTYGKAHNNIALAYYNSGQLERALEHFKRAVELEPANLESYNNLGLVYKKMGDFRKAEEAFATALSVDPGHAPSNYNMAMLCEEDGRYDRAVDYYRAYIRSKGATPELARKVNQRLARLTRTEAPK